MKLPKVSVGGLMSLLVVVAIDCFIYRLLQSRPESLIGTMIDPVVMSTLPMANLLTLGIAGLVGSRSRRSPSRTGLAVGAFLGVLATIVGLRPALDRIESVVTWLGLIRWVGSSPIAEVVLYGIFVFGLPFLFQSFAGLIGARIGRAIGDRREYDSSSEGPERPPAGRTRLAALVTLVALAALPAVTIEMVLRWNVKPALARFPAGLPAVIDLANPQAGPVLLPAASPIRRLDGVKVLVESDREPMMIEGFMKKNEPRPHFRDHRIVRVTLATGAEPAHSTVVPHYLLRPIR